MKNRLLLLVLLAGCQVKLAETKNESTTASTDLVVSAADTPTPVADEIATTFTVTEERVNFTTYLEPRTEIFGDTLGGSPPMDFITEFLPVNVVSRSDTRRGETDNICSQYYWYQIALTDTTSGWVFGAKVMLDLDAQSSGHELDMEGSMERLLFLQDAGIGASDENGLTGCAEYAIPYFFNLDNRTFRFIKITEQVDSRFHLTSYNGWVAFLNGEGGSTIVKSVRYDESQDNYSMILLISYQDGGIEADLRFLHDGVDLKFISLSEIQSEELSDEPSESEH